MRQLERRLAAELDHDADGLLALADRQHFFDTEGLEVQPVRRVVIRRDRLGVAVHHHGLEPELAIAARRVHAAVVELDPLSDPVGPGAEDDDAAPGPGRMPRPPRPTSSSSRWTRPRPPRRRSRPAGTPAARPTTAASRARARLARRAVLGDRGIRPPRALDSNPVVRDERIERRDARQRPARRLELTFEPRMEIAGLPAVVELACPLRLEERLAEGAGRSPLPRPRTSSASPASGRRPGTSRTRTAGT